MSIDQSVLDKFEAVVESQRKRIMDMKAQDDFIDYSRTFGREISSSRLIAS